MNTKQICLKIKCILLAILFGAFLNGGNFNWCWKLLILLFSHLHLVCVIVCGNEHLIDRLLHKTKKIRTKVYFTFPEVSYRITSDCTELHFRKQTMENSSSYRCVCVLCYTACVCAACACNDHRMNGDLRGISLVSKSCALGGDQLFIWHGRMLWRIITWIDMRAGMISTILNHKNPLVSVYSYLDDGSAILVVIWNAHTYVCPWNREKCPFDR